MESDAHQDKKEMQYCNLLKFPLPWIRERVGKTLIQIEEVNRRIPIEYLKQAWGIRWIYTYPERGLETGIKLMTLKNRIKKGEIKVNKIFKRASFRTSVKNGTPDKCSEELIEVALEKTRARSWG